MSYFFKNEQEIKEFFRDTAFKFEVLTEDSVLIFNTLIPIELDESNCLFKVTFLYDGQTFYDYSSFSDCLEGIEIHEVVKKNIQESLGEEILYLR